MPNDFRYTQIHRFHDDVAIFFDGTADDGATTYLSKAQAKEIGEQLVKYADDIESKTFLESQIGTFTLEGGE